MIEDRLSIKEFRDLVESCPDDMFAVYAWHRGDHRCCLLAVARHHFGVDLAEGCINTGISYPRIADFLMMNQLDVKRIVIKVDGISPWIQYAVKDTILRVLEET